MAKPTTGQNRKQIKVGLHSIIDIVQEIQRLGHAESFQSAAKEAGAYVSVSPTMANFVKTYLSDRNLAQKSEMAATLAGGCPDPYQCPYGM